MIYRKINNICPFCLFMIIHIDISGQIVQKNHDSAMGFKRSDGLTNSVFLKKEIKKELLNKYKGQVTNLIEKTHTILVFYCIQNHLGNVKEIKICKDCNPRKIKFFIPGWVNTPQCLGSMVLAPPTILID